MFDYRRTRRSAIWNVFTETHKADFIATCNICSHDFSYRTTTTNLFRHLEKKHPGVRVDVNYVRQKPKEIPIPEENENSNEILTDQPQQECEAGLLKVETLLITEGDCNIAQNSSKMKSAIWDHFRKLSSSDSIASCNYCHKELSYKTTIFNLKRHLGRKHAERMSEVDESNCKLIIYNSDEEVPSDNEKGCNTSNEEKIPDNDNEKSSISEVLNTNRYVSPVWKFFTKLSASGFVASCNICNKELSYKTTTTNLHRHIERKHPQYSLVDESQNISKSNSDDRNYVLSVSAKNGSPLWNYLTKDPDYEFVASCNLCDKKISYKTTTQDLKKHLEKKHGNQLLEMSQELTGDPNNPSQSFVDDPLDDEEQQPVEIPNESSELQSNKNQQDNDDDNDFWNQDNNSDEDTDFRASPEFADMMDVKNTSSIKLRSKVWNAFTKKPMSDGVAICKVCNLEFSYRTTTNNLKKHFEKKHPTLTYEIPLNLNTKTTNSVDELNVKQEDKKCMDTEDFDSSDGAVFSNRRRRSQIWNFFTRKASGELVAICKICRKELSFRSTISDLKKHLDKKHPNIGIKMETENDEKMVDFKSDQSHVKMETSEDYADEDGGNSSEDATPKSPAKNRRKRSLIWNYFTRKKFGEYIASCNVCKKELKFKSSIWDLKKHMMKMHPHIKMKGKSDVKQETTDNDAPSKKSVPDILKTCLICLQTDQMETKEFVAIKHSDSQEKDYLTKIQEITNQTIDIDESHVLCKTCVDDIEKVIKFRKNVNKSLEFWSKIDLEPEPEPYDNSADVFNDSDYSDVEDEETLAKFTCSKCNKEFPSSSAMLKHNCDHKEPKQTDNVPKFTCNKCHKVFSSSSDVARHNCDQQQSIKDRKRDTDRFCCERCGRSFNMKSKLNSHLKICQRDASQQFVCSLCGKIFKKAYHLREHMAAHTGEHNYSCKLCGKTFQRQSSKYRHMRSHNAKPGEKSKKTPFLCTICGKSFPYSNGASRHMRVHLGIKRHQCHICLKRFMEAAHLKVHIRTHTGERPYGCMICGRAFSLNATLRKHMRLHVGPGDLLRTVNNMENFV